MALGGKWPEPRVLATGLRFPEGPVYLGDGAVVFTEIQGQCISRFDGKTASMVAASVPSGRDLRVD